jgi:serine/threonine protein kinase
MPFYHRTRLLQVISRKSSFRTVAYGSTSFSFRPSHAVTGVRNWMSTVAVVVVDQPHESSSMMMMRWSSTSSVAPVAAVASSAAGGRQTTGTTTTVGWALLATLFLGGGLVASSNNNTSTSHSTQCQTILSGPDKMAATATTGGHRNNDNNLQKQHSKQKQSEEEPFVLKQHYTLQKVLGQGAYGMVYQAVRVSDGTVVAVKTLSRQSTGATTFEAEVAAMQQLRDDDNENGHENIVQLYDLHRDEQNYYLVMELVVDGMELYDHLIANGAFSEATAATFLRQCAEAVHYIHCRNLVHGDLKPENLMLSPQSMTLKLVDFGCACSHDTSRNDMLLPAEIFALGCSFLHRVALGNQFELERMLQQRPSLVNFRDYDNRTPLHLAASEGHVDICRFLWGGHR